MTDSAEQLQSIIPLIRLITAERVGNQSWLFEDAEQEARIAAWQILEQGHSTKLASFKAKQAVIDALRGGRATGSKDTHGGRVDSHTRARSLIRTTADGSEEYVYEPADHRSAIEQERFEARAALREALGVLSARDREIVHATFYDGLNRAEVAERYGLTHQAISQVLNRAYAKMRSVIAA